MNEAAHGISVIIPNLNGAPYLGPCMTSVFEQGLDAAELDVILIDNASTDDSLSIVRDGFPTVRIIANSWNVGFTLAVNQGLKEATRDLILLLNNDTVMQPGALAQLLSALQSGPKDLAGVQPLLLWAGDSNIVDSAGIALVRPFTARDDLHGQPVQLAPQSAREVWGTCFACVLIRRNVFDECGTLDPDFFAEWDDVDWCLRARWLGYRFQLNPAAIVLHHRSPTSKRDPLAKIVRLRRNRLLTIVKGLPGSMAWALIGRKVLRDISMSVHYLKKGEFVGEMRVWAQLLRLFPAMMSRRRVIRRTARLSTRQMKQQLRQFLAATRA